MVNKCENLEMSVVPKETIQVIAQSIGINSLSPEVALALAPDVEYRVREIMQEAMKCMRHSRRTVLTSDDVDSALKLRNVEPLYGLASNDPSRFKRASGHKDLYYVDDRDLEFKEVIETPLPKAPLDTGSFSHWLAIEGVQPAIPENPPIEVPAAPSDGRKEYKEDGLPVDIKLPVKHVLSRELQLYYEKIIEIAMRKCDSILFKEALVSLATDTGLHPLVPYLTYFISDKVSKNLNNFDILFALMRIVSSLLRNPHVHVEPYLHQMMPSAITCLVAKGLGNRLSDNHWELRKFSANLVATVCRRFGHIYHDLQPRVTRTLLHTFLDPVKTLPQQYGAIEGLAALGPSVVRLLILPNLETFMRLLEPEMLLEKQKNEFRRQEAWRVYGALMFACGQCLHERMKKFRSLPYPSSRTILRSKCKVVTSPPNKRKASMDNSVQQPPLKKIATDQSIAGVMRTSSSAGNFQARRENSVGSGQPQFQSQKSSSSSVLSQPWKHGSDHGQLVASFSEFFGHSIFSFTPSPELSVFL